MHDQRLAFMVAGVQKAGTSALFSYLSEHPELQPPADKEPHIFDADDWSELDDPQTRVASWFPPGDGRLRFEATPITLYWPQALERVKRYRADMRFVLMFRDPVERAFSQWRMERARGQEPADFAWCIREGRRRFTGAHRIFSYVERGFYGAQFAHALRLFPRGQFLCLHMGALHDRPGQTLEKVAHFLGIAAPGPVSPRVIRPPAPTLPGLPTRPDPADVDYLQRLYDQDMARFAELSGLSWRSSAGA